MNDFKKISFEQYTTYIEPDVNINELYIAYRKINNRFKIENIFVSADTVLVAPPIPNIVNRSWEQLLKSKEIISFKN